MVSLDLIFKVQKITQFNDDICIDIINLSDSLGLNALAFARMVKNFAECSWELMSDG